MYAGGAGGAGARQGQMMGKGESERGATLVEAALVLPIMIMLMISLLELGMAFRDLLTVSYTAREAAHRIYSSGEYPE